MLFAGEDIKSNNLEIEFFYKTEMDKAARRKTFTVVCRCGNRKLMLARACVRCHECGRGHDYMTFLKKKEECYRSAFAEDGRTGRIKQWTPEKTDTNIYQLNAQTGEIKIVDGKYASKMKTQYFYCSSCRRSLPWTNENRLKGIGPPVAEWGEGKQEKCFDCIRDLTKTLIRN